ncbi:hypothetical protein GCM10010372_82650 [Streptomyces tauricus]|nr:hypothetical protein GCM10010372_82650 [Streptomyces tauricus]
MVHGLYRAVRVRPETGGRVEAQRGPALAPLDATYQAAKVWIFLKNVRAATRRAAEIEQRRAEGLPVESSVGALSDDRREQLEEIDAS